MQDDKDVPVEPGIRLESDSDKTKPEKEVPIEPGLLTRLDKDKAKSNSDKDQGQVLEYEAAFELTGYGRMNYLVLFACCMIFVYCSQEMTGIAYVITPAECDLEMDVKQKSMVNSGIFIGVVASAICWGTLSDRYGRRKVMLPALIGSMILSFLSSLSTGFWTMFTLRMLTGLLVSASSATVLVYLSELHSKKHRDRAIAIAVTSDQVNFVLFPGIAWIVIPGSWSFSVASFVVRPWRVFMWTWSITGIIGTALLFKLPESPRFLLATKGSIETTSVLAHIFSCNERKRSDEYPVTCIKTDARSITNFKNEGYKKMFKDLSLLIRAPLRRCFFVTHLCMFIVNLLANGLYMWMPALINETLKDINRKESVCDVIQVKYMDKTDLLMDIGQWSPHAPHEDIPRHESVCEEGVVVALTYPLSMATELFYLLPFILVIVFISKYKPNKIYALMMFMCSVALAGSCVCPQVLAANVLIILGLCSGSAASLLSALAVDAFPTKLRALAMCTMFMMGQFGTIFGICIMSLMKGLLCQILFFTISGLVIVSVLVITLLWPDMKLVKQEMENRMFSY